MPSPAEPRRTQTREEPGREAAAPSLAEVPSREVPLALTVTLTPAGTLR